ncbi:MAG: transcription antitermination factor NusB [Rickettsiales bacterium]
MTKPAKPNYHVKPVLNARAQAQGLLNLVLGGALTVDEALARAPMSGEAADQRFAILLALTTLQHLGQLDAAIANFLETPLPVKRLAVSNALRLGAAQLLFLDTPAHAAVNETVALVKKGKDAALSGLVNAVLQKMAADKPTLRPATKNLPQWLRNRWEKQYGVAAVATICDIAAQRAPLDIHSMADMEGAERLDSQMLRIRGEHPPVEELPGYDTGAFFIQDIAASYPARLLGEVKGLRLLDACAAPGGKTAQLARAGARVTALDRSHARMRLLRDNMARLNCEVEVVVDDAMTWQPAEPFDAILLDAPCTATGTWRRHPEVVQILKKEEIAEMATLQRALLSRAWEWLKPSGKLVYCVCSLEPEEGEQQAQWFLEATNDASLITCSPLEGERALPLQCRGWADSPDAAGFGEPPLPPTNPQADLTPPQGRGWENAIPLEYFTSAGYLRTTPATLADKGGMDGFFAVCFMRAR